MSELDDAERFKRLFIDPAVEAMGQRIESQLEPIVRSLKEREAMDAKQNDRLDVLESAQSKALVGWGIFSMGIGAAISLGWNWIASKFTSEGK